MTYDSRPDTEKHIQRVQALMQECAQELQDRGYRHDLSKLQPPEKEAFDRETPNLRSLTYGSKEYNEAKARLGEALKHHYAHNSHHPEHYCIIEVAPAGTFEGSEPQYTIVEELVSGGHGIRSMSLFDVLEMLMDWKAASERHDDGDIWKSIDHNAQRFGISPQLEFILRETAKEMGW